MSFICNQTKPNTYVPNSVMHNKMKSIDMYMYVVQTQLYVIKPAIASFIVHFIVDRARERNPVYLNGNFIWHLSKGVNAYLLLVFALLCFVFVSMLQRWLNLL